jgi:hypothetical protein
MKAVQFSETTVNYATGLRHVMSCKTCISYYHCGPMTRTEQFQSEMQRDGDEERARTEEELSGFLYPHNNK